MRKKELGDLFRRIYEAEKMHQNEPEEDDWFDEQSTYGCESGYIPD